MAGGRRFRRRRAVLVVLAAAALPALSCAPGASAERALLSAQVVPGGQVPNGELEDACGVAVDGTTTYVSNYYPRSIEVFNPGGFFESLEADPHDGACQLALGPGGELYANVFHGRVERILPSRLVIDAGTATGVAVDPVSGDVYVNHRTYVSVYDASGAPVLDEGAPLQLGLGSLGDGYGLAVAGGRVYIADAGDSAIKVYEPGAGDAPVLVIDGAATPQGGFSSLIDASLAIDPVAGHLVLVDNLQPGFEHPEAVLDEFGLDGGFLGQVSHHLIDSEPTGLAFRGANLLVTNGNSEASAVFEFGPYTVGLSPSAAPARAQASLEAGGAGNASSEKGITVAAPVVRRERRSQRHDRGARRHRHSIWIGDARAAA
jgi:hypothetical protein